MSKKFASFPPAELGALAVQSLTNPSIQCFHPFNMCPLSGISAAYTDSTHSSHLEPLCTDHQTLHVSLQSAQRHIPAAQYAPHTEVFFGADRMVTKTADMQGVLWRPCCKAAQITIWMRSTVPSLQAGMAWRPCAARYLDGRSWTALSARDAAISGWPGNAPPAKLIPPKCQMSP